MSNTFNRRLLLVWAILTLLTLAYVWMDEAVDQNQTLTASTVVECSGGQ